MWQRPDVAETLRWYIEAGVDEFVGEEPVDRFTLDRRIWESLRRWEPLRFGAGAEPRDG